MSKGGRGTNKGFKGEGGRVGRQTVHEEQRRVRMRLDIDLCVWVCCHLSLGLANYLLTPLCEFVLCVVQLHTKPTQSVMNKCCIDWGNTHGYI